MKRSLPLLASTLALLLTSTGVHADLSPVNTVAWTYNFTPASPQVLADGGAGTGGVSFTNEQTKSAVGSSDVVVANLRIFSTSSASSPDVLNSNGTYSVALALTDTASGQTGTLTFAGKLSGSFSKDNANVTNGFTTSGPTSVVLGGNTYTISLSAYSPPGPPSATNAGSISAHVDVAPGGVHVAKVPEPSTMLLSCLGFSLLGGASWRKRRQRAAQIAA